MDLEAEIKLPPLPELRDDQVEADTVGLFPIEIIGSEEHVFRRVSRSHMLPNELFDAAGGFRDLYVTGQKGGLSCNWEKKNPDPKALLQGVHKPPETYCVWKANVGDVRNVGRAFGTQEPLLVAHEPNPPQADPPDIAHCVIRDTVEGRKNNKNPQIRNALRAVFDEVWPTSA